MNLYAKGRTALILALLFLSSHASIASEPIEQARHEYDQKNYEKCVEILEKAVSGSLISNQEAHYWLAKGLKKVGRVDQAKLHLERALELSPYSWIADDIKRAIRDLNDPQSGKIKSSKSKGGRVGFVGLHIYSDNVVARVLPGSPAEKGRLRKGDLIVSVDGVKSGKLSLDEVSKRIRGPEGTIVTLVVERNGKRYRTRLKRAEVTHTHRSVEFVERKTEESGRRQQEDKSPTPNRTRVRERADSSRTAKSSLNDKQFVSVFRQTRNSLRTKEEVLRALTLIPDVIRKELYDWGLRIVVTPSVLDAFPGFKTQKPRGYIHGGGYDNCGGLYYNKRIYVAERVSHYNHPLQKNVFLAYTLLHEFGHAYDHCHGVLQNQSYKIAYKNDRDRLPNEGIRKFRYFTQPGDAGRSELFAELFVDCFGATEVLGTDLSRFKTAFPRSFKFVRSLLQVQ